jgi:multiple sugar transport system substrate-binding protein
MKFFGFEAVESNFWTALKTKKIAVVFFVFVVVVAGIYFYAHSAPRDDLDPKNPVVLTIWHNPTGQDVDALSAAMDRFNRSVGRRLGVSVIVTTIAKSEILHEKLTAIALGNTGAPEPPDIAIAYPKSASILAAKGMLAAFDGHFTQDELDEFVPSFIENGRLRDGGLYVFPIGKSAEGLIVNKTFWDRFSGETGTPASELATFEGLIRAAAKYYAWTDAKTPNVENDGSAFFFIDNPFNLAQAAFAQAGEDLFAGDRLNVESPTYRRVFEMLFEPAVRGHEATGYSGYGTDIAKTGKLLCWFSSTAGMTFVPKKVTYDDNTSEPVEFEMLPYPVFEDGKKVVMQRGGGFCLFKSTPTREKAAVLFLKWLVSPEENLSYLENMGYMPVTKKAMKTAGETWGKNASGIEKSYIETMKIMGGEYEFLSQKQLDNYAELEVMYDRRVRKAQALGRETYLTNLRFGEEVAWRLATEHAYEKFIE